MLSSNKFDVMDLLLWHYKVLSHEMRGIVSPFPQCVVTTKIPSVDNAVDLDHHLQLGVVWPPFFFLKNPGLERRVP